MFSSLFEIVFANFGFWFNFALPVASALYLALTHKEYIWKEFGIQAGSTFVFVVLIYSLLFSTTTDLIDNEYWSAKVSKFEYYEEWKEEVTYTESYSCGSSKNPKTCTRTKTRIDYHPPYWQITTSNGEIVSMTRSEYKTASNQFGHKEVDIRRFDQVSWGDGDKYVSVPNIIIPTSVSHTYENLVKAVKSNVVHTKVPQENIDLALKDGILKDYPTRYKDKFGAPKLNRFIDVTGVVKADYINPLNAMSIAIGQVKQGNPIIYVVNEPRSFTDVISQHWSKGKKNDVTLVVGIDDSGLIVWTDVITYTNNTDFIVDMQNDFLNLDMNKDSTKILAIYKKHVMNGYIRKEMKEFAYLKDNITLEWYWQLFIFLMNAALTTFITWKFLNNYDRKR
ncbi:MAG: hypothetical protein DRH57_08515 [Candidatus Cloacimonadota bacterium]|nr:MAG: hypothetical protein DRH57_08515 [Candidatus Cloacimonadota bacterium]